MHDPPNPMMTVSSTRRRFLRQSALATLGGLAAASPGITAPAGREDFSFILLGDLHFDRLEHHDLDWLQKHKAGDLRQIQNYSRITQEVTPALFATVRETVAALQAEAVTKPAFVLQVGDLVEGLCGTEELATVQNREAVKFVEDSDLNLPFLFTKGNHDVTGDGATAAFASVFHPYLTAQARKVTSATEELKSARYTVQHGDALFCFFDAYDPESLAWLESVLARRTARHCFVVIHPPVVPYGARSTWHLFAREKQKAQREKLLDLLGKNSAFVLGGHIHKFNALTRATPGGGRFTQLAVCSVVGTPDPQVKEHLPDLASYTGDQVLVEPKHSPETVAERRAVYDAERPLVKSFEYADLPGHTVVKVQGGEVTAEIYSGITRKRWKTVDLSGLLKGA
ncbi:MAG: metallophosphoesterase [Verrucomicrobiota bacterium]